MLIRKKITYLGLKKYFKNLYIVFPFSFLFFFFSPEWPQGSIKIDNDKFPIKICHVRLKLPPLFFHKSFQRDLRCQTIFLGRTNTDDTCTYL